MMNCAKCNGLMSRNAKTCPQCQHPHPLNLGHCRVCGTVLAHTAHRYRMHYSSPGTVVNGNTVGGGGGSFIFHAPCPQCGEPKPLRQFTDTGIGKLLYLLATIAAVWLLSKVFSRIPRSAVQKAIGPPVAWLHQHYGLSLVQIMFLAWALTTSVVLLFYFLLGRKARFRKGIGG